MPTTSERGTRPTGTSQVPERIAADAPGTAQAVSIVVPTFREAANLPVLVARLQAALAAGGIEWELILVDDQSDDGSALVAADLAKSYPVRMEIRADSPRDLSRSVLRGFQLARFERLVVLDADLSHPPERIPDLLAALDRGGDMVVGSRYAPGGMLEHGWSWWRFLHSRVATALAAPLASCSDPLSGFFAIRRGALPGASRLRPIGYKIGLELMVRGQLRVSEVPIEFSDRAAGASKTSWRQRVRFLRHVYRLRLFQHGGWPRALGVGLARCGGPALDVAGYLWLHAAGLDHRVARFLSCWGPVLWDRGRKLRDAPAGAAPPRLRLGGLARLGTSGLVGLGANAASFALLTTFVNLFDRYRLGALACSVGIGGIASFLVRARSTYRAHCAARPSGE